MKSFLSLGHLSPEEIRDLVALARRLERKPEPAALAGRVLGLLFFDPSLRTLASMQSAMARLGGLLAPTAVALVVGFSFTAALAMFAAMLALGAMAASLIDVETRGAPLE